MYICCTHIYLLALQGGDKRKLSMCESVASTISADHPSDPESLTSDDDDNAEDNDISGKIHQQFAKYGNSSLDTVTVLKIRHM